MAFWLSGTASALVGAAAGALLLAMRARRAAGARSDSPGVDHVVLFRLKDYPEKLDTALRGLSDGGIPGVLDVSVGATYSTARSWGYTHGIVVRLASKQALSVYADHPQHLAVVPLIKDVLDVSAGDGAPPAVLALDIECDRML